MAGYSPGYPRRAPSVANPRDYSHASHTRAASSVRGHSTSPFHGAGLGSTSTSRFGGPSYHAGTPYESTTHSTYSNRPTISADREQRERDQRDREQREREQREREQREMDQLRREREEASHHNFYSHTFHNERLVPPVLDATDHGPPLRTTLRSGLVNPNPLGSLGSARGREPSTREPALTTATPPTTALPPAPDSFRRTTTPVLAGRSAAHSGSSQSTSGSFRLPAAPRDDVVRVVPFGFRNLGNTCYLNATLQCVVHTPDFIRGIAKEQRRAVKSDVVGLIVELMTAGGSSGHLLAGIKQKTSLLNAEFVGYGQNDGHEFLRALLHAIHNEINRSRGAKYEQLDDKEGETESTAARRWAEYHRAHDDSVVYDTFGGQLKHVTVCGKCNLRSLSFDPFLDLSLPLPKSGVFGTSSYELGQVLASFAERETLSGAEQFLCPKCKKLRDAYRQTTVSAFPKNLVLHLKRFSSSGSKNSAKVKYPSSLKVPPSLAGSGERDPSPYTYSLHGVVLHSGTAHFGHYTSYVRSPVDNQWYLCDDSRVQVVSEAEVLDQRTAAYFLFYRKEGLL